MALMTLGRIPFTAEALGTHRSLVSGMGDRMDTLAATDPAVVQPELEEAKVELAEAEKELEKARHNLLTSLAPWIPGDYLIVYGILLTAWSRLRGNFPALLLVAVASSIVFGVDPVRRTG
jgi:hypothetical protein